MRVTAVWWWKLIEINVHRPSQISGPCESQPNLLRTVSLKALLFKRQSRDVESEFDCPSSLSRDESSKKHLSLLKQWKRERKKGPHSANSRLGYIIFPNKRLQPVILTHYIFDFKCRFHFLYLIRPRRRLRIFRLLFSAFLLSLFVIVCLLLYCRCLVTQVKMELLMSKLRTWNN